MILKIPWGKILRRCLDSGFRESENKPTATETWVAVRTWASFGPRRLRGQRGRRRRIAKAATPTRMPQKADTMPNGWMPDTVTTRVIRAASITAGW